MSFHRRQLLQTLPFAFRSSFLLPRNEFAMAAKNPAQPANPAIPAGPAKAAAAQEPATKEKEKGEKEKVVGIGGLFFRAHDPKALGQWYREHLGIGLAPTGGGEHVWQQEAGPTVFAPFPETTKYFGDPNKMWMVNFRVRDLEKMMAQLRAAGIEVKAYPPDPNGRFAHLHDPEGNPIELWQPA